MKDDFGEWYREQVNNVRIRPPRSYVDYYFLFYDKQWTQKYCANTRDWEQRLLCFVMSVSIPCLLAFILNYMNWHQKKEKELEITHSASEIFSITLDAVFCLAVGRNDMNGSPPGTAASRIHLKCRSQTQISSITKWQFEFFIAIGDVFEKAFSFMVLITARWREKNGKLLGCESLVIKSECFRSFFKRRTTNKGYITRNSV